MKYYFYKNRLWITPAIGGFLSAIIPVMILSIEGPHVDAIPGWAPFVPLSFGILGAISGAIHTTTASAYVVRYVGSAAIVAAILYAVPLT